MGYFFPWGCWASMGLLLHRVRFDLFITQLLLNYYRIITDLSKTFHRGK